MPISNPRLRGHLIADLPPADALIDDLRLIDSTRRYTNFGPLCVAYESGLRQRLSDGDALKQTWPIHLTSLFSCYHALEIGLRLLGAKTGKTVLVPAVTFPACPLAVQHTGAAVVLGDIDADSWTLTPAIARRIAAKTKIDIVMPVALYGVSLPAADWDDFSRDTGIAVIMDAAAAIGTQTIPTRCLVAHSLHATKPFGIGEGGILVGRDFALIEQARRASNFGTTDRIAYEDGINAKLSEYHAAVGLAQLRRWDAIVARRREVLMVYQRELARLGDAVTLQVGIEQAVVSCLMLRLREPKAEALFRLALEQGFGLHRTYLPPLYRHPYFADLPLMDGNGRAATESLPGCEAMVAHVIGVPFHPFLEVSDIAEAVGLLGMMLLG
jgi:dTDP-4-amino-4,6-dideoxygalactose transaminase